VQKQVSRPGLVFRLLVEVFVVAAEYSQPPETWLSIESLEVFFSFPRSLDAIQNGVILYMRLNRLIHPYTPDGLMAIRNDVIPYVD